MFDFTPVDAGRWIAASGIVASYAAFCWHQFRQSRRGAKAPITQGVATDTEPILIVYASQSGQAEAIAKQTAQALSADNRQIHLRRIEEDWQAEASAARCVLFVVSTYGEGSAPDHALRFVQANLDAGIQAKLQGIRYGLLALGDRSYPAFCAFGRQLDAWLQASGARPQFERIEVDRLDAEALSSWQQQLSTLSENAPSSWTAETQDYSPWQFVERQCLNAGSPGSPIFLVVLQAISDDTPQWQAGDLVDILVPQGDGYPRAYSIANLPTDGRIELIVRKHIRDNGQTGLASGWLTEHAQVGDQMELKIRSNPGFHLQHDISRPLMLIGSGAGIAGLRAHLQARAKAIEESGNPAPQRNAWLFFGERSGRHDHLCKLEIEEWKRSQVLTKVDMSFSRDDPVTPYVQHNLLARSKEVCEWIESGAQILICGNAKKMAPGIDKALRSILGSQQVDLLMASGRIRRDVF
ncbi:MAG: oxidoreductase [Proteobacteria bacterium]|nr:oxidoreductase [Pseudomonadota bacterium]